MHTQLHTHIRIATVLMWRCHVLVNHMLVITDEWLQVQGKELPCSQCARPQGSAEGVWNGPAQGDHHPSPGLQRGLQVRQQLCLSSWLHLPRNVCHNDVLALQ